MMENEATIETLQEWLAKDLDSPEHQLGQKGVPTGSCQQDFECPLLWLVRSEGNRECKKGSMEKGCAADNVWMENVVRCCARDTKVIEFMDSCKQGEIIIRKRKPLPSWTDEDKKKFEEAYRKMQSTIQHEGRRRFNIWHDMVAFHKYSGRKHGAPSIHSSESFEKSFLPWHRYYLWEFETNLQYYANDCSVTLPYTQTHILHKDSIDHIFGEDTLYGPLKRARLKKGVGRDFQFENQDVYRDPAARGELRPFKNAKFPIDPQSTYAKFSELLESGEASGSEVPVHHNIVHGMIGGTMGAFESPADPLFFLHHAWVDYKWWEWQQEGLKIGNRQVRSCHDCVTGHEGMFSLQQWVNTFDQPNEIVVPGDADLKITTQVVYLTPEQAKSTSAPTTTTSTTTSTSTTQKICCRAMTASCMACSANQSVEKFCEENPNVVGCKESECKDADNGRKDATGDTCEVYWQNKAWCGGYDTPQFNAKELCCACKDGAKTTTTTTTTKAPGQCTSTNGNARDSDGDSCDVYRGSGKQYCGKYDDDDFKSMQMCCGCGGGSSKKGGEGQCEDKDNGKTDKDGDSCQVYALETGYCGRFDDDDFKSEQMCCACGGGSKISGSGRPPNGRNCRDKNRQLSREFGWEISCGQVVQIQPEICEASWFKEMCCSTCNAISVESEVSAFNTDPEFFEATYPIWILLAVIFSTIACLLMCRVFRRCRQKPVSTETHEKLLTDCTEDMTEDV